MPLPYRKRLGLSLPFPMSGSWDTENVVAAGAQGAFTSTGTRLYFVVQPNEQARNRLVVYDQSLVRQTSEEFTFPTFGSDSDDNIVSSIFVTGDASSDNIYVLTTEAQQGVIDSSLNPDIAQFDTSRVWAFNKSGAAGSDSLWIPEYVRSGFRGNGHVVGIVVDDAGAIYIMAQRAFRKWSGLTASDPDIYHRLRVGNGQTLRVQRSLVTLSMW